MSLVFCRTCCLRDFHAWFSRIMGSNIIKRNAGSLNDDVKHDIVINFMLMSTNWAFWMENLKLKYFILCKYYAISHTALFAYSLKLNISTRSRVTKILSKKSYCKFKCFSQCNEENQMLIRSWLLMLSLVSARLQDMAGFNKILGAKKANFSKTAKFLKLDMTVGCVNFSSEKSQVQHLPILHSVVLNHQAITNQAKF